MFEQLHSFIANNQFASGGLLLGIGAGILAYARSIPSKLYTKIIRLISYDIKIKHGTELFKYINEYFAIKQPARWSRNFNVSLDSTKNIPLMSLGEGQHFFFHNKVLFICNRGIKEKQNTSGRGNSHGEEGEYFDIKIFTKNKQFVLDWLKEVITTVEPDIDNIKIYKQSRWDDWLLLRSLPPRDEKHIILEGDVFQELYDDIQRFYERKDWFKNLGIPYKRGYLLHGAPGNGKTSTIIGLASKFRIPVYIITKLDAGTIEKLPDLFTELPEKAFVVFEDVDSMLLKTRPVNTKEETNDTTEDEDDWPNDTENVTDTSKINMSGLLNAIDGIASPEGYIMFMTTNFPENLDAALVRPGRIDKKIEFKNPNHNQIKRFLKKFIPTATEIEQTIFADNMITKNLSAATLQEFLITNDTIEKALEASKNE